MEDPMSRDGKRLPLSSSCAALPYFLLCAFVVLPLTVGVLLPLLLVHTIIFKLLGLCGIGRARRDKASAAGDRENALLPTGDSAPAAATSAASVAVAVANAPAAANRVHDIVLFGATGFTGKLAAQYLAARYSGKDSNVHWAIAGRRAAALESLRAELQLSELPIIIADATDGASLAAMAASAKVVLATAGPFALHGSEVVRACAEAGTHYCDITGETDWVRQMIDRFDDTAKRTGSTIVHFCGHDCVPWDLSVLACADHLRAAGDAQLARISCYDSIVFWPSGGTLATFINSLSGRELYKSRLGFDPLVKSPSGAKSPAVLNVNTQGFMGYDNASQQWVGPFVMAAVMANCIRRSNVIKKYSDKLGYYEAQVYPNFMAAFVATVLTIAIGICIIIVPIRWLLIALGVLPAPGDGPSKEKMDEGFLKVTTLATGASGKKCKSVFYFPTDPGYRDTARMLVESGVTLVLNRDQCVQGGGVHTPASALGQALIQRLVASGSTFSIEDL